MGVDWSHGPEGKIVPGKDSWRGVSVFFFFQLKKSDFDLHCWSVLYSIIVLMYLIYGMTE